MSKVQEINSSQFDSFVEGKKVVVDFYAEWCGPCRMLSPLIDQLSEEYKDVTFIKFNVDNEKNIAQRFNISSIPNVLFFNDGKPVDGFLGFKSIEAIKALLAKNNF